MVLPSLAKSSLTRALLGAVLVAGALLAWPSRVPPTEGQGAVALGKIGQFNAPVYATHANDGTGRLFVVEQAGTIRIYASGQWQPTAFLDIQSIVQSSESEQGLLGFALHPSFASNGLFYVSYTRSDRALQVTRYSVSTTNPNLANPSSGVPIITVPHPNFTNHNGGMLAFGPDGYLYVSTGDGGSGGDPSNNAQNLGVLLGKILRIDVNGGSPYAIPPTNPFVGQAGVRPEIWAYGLRNPWRLSFDRLTGDLYIGDVGQNMFEEIDFQPASSPGGQNYGWRITEAFNCFNPNPCNQTGLTPPILAYDHNSGDCSVTGGYRYRGTRVSALLNSYVYADYCSGRIWTARLNGGTWSSSLLLATNLLIASFGEVSADGELVVVDQSVGGVYVIYDPTVPTPTRTPTATPNLSTSPTPTRTVTQTPTRTPTQAVSSTPSATATATSTRTPTPTPGGTEPDLIVEGVWVGATTASQQVGVRVRVKNQGGSSTGIEFHVHVHDGISGPMVLHIVVPPMAAGSAVNLDNAIPAGTLAAGSHTLIALADGHNVILESNESNNWGLKTFNLAP